MSVIGVIGELESAFNLILNVNGRMYIYIYILRRVRSHIKINQTDSIMRIDEGNAQ